MAFREKLSWIQQNFTELVPDETLALDLRYATTNNFMNEDLYLGFNRCFLHPEAAALFAKARERLRREHPGWRFHVWDALRPVSVQRKMRAFVADTPYRDYVAPPEPGSLHNFGFAIDLTLEDETGTLLDMGTEFDDFADLAQPRLETEHLRSGLLSKEAFANRERLRSLMHEAGFRVLPHEWWHFNAKEAPLVHGHYPRLE